MKIPSYRYHFVIALMLGISSPLVGFGESNSDRYSLIQEGERQDLLSGDGGSAHHDEASMNCETEGLLRLTALDSLDGPLLVEKIMCVIWPPVQTIRIVLPVYRKTRPVSHRTLPMMKREVYPFGCPQGPMVTKAGTLVTLIKGHATLK